MGRLQASILKFCGYYFPYFFCGEEESLNTDLKDGQRTEFHALSVCHVAARQS